MQEKLIKEVQDLTDEGAKDEPKKNRRIGDYVKDDIDPNSAGMLATLQGRAVYGGTADAEVVRKRRLKNKRARAARRRSRKS